MPTTRDSSRSSGSRYGTTATIARPPPQKPFDQRLNAKPSSGSTRTGFPTSRPSPPMRGSTTSRRWLGPASIERSLPCSPTTPAIARCTRRSMSGCERPASPCWPSGGRTMKSLVRPAPRRFVGTPRIRASNSLTAGISSWNPTSMTSGTSVVDGMLQSATDQPICSLESCPMRRARGWAARGPASLHMVELERRDLRPEAIALRVDYCGVCHSDLHALHEYAQRTAGAESSEDPFVPGHECTGTVTEVGTEVTRFAVGDTVAVGNIVDACLRCDMCTAGQENYCREFPTLTYGGVDRHDGTPTRGAFARELVVREEFAHHLPPGLDPAAAAPLLCAGITVWEPLRALAVSSGTRLAVVGLGGLGHLAVKLAVALGAEVTVLSRSAAKADDARRLGAHHLLVSTDEVAMTRARGSFDVVLDSVAEIGRAA